LTVLNLGDDLDVTAIRAKNLADILDVLASPDESCGADVSKGGLIGLPAVCEQLL
jgi:hypothetical protein